MLIGLAVLAYSSSSSFKPPILNNNNNPSSLPLVSPSNNPTVMPSPLIVQNSPELLTLSQPLYYLLENSLVRIGNSSNTVPSTTPGVQDLLNLFSVSNVKVFRDGSDDGKSASKWDDQKIQKFQQLISSWSKTGPNHGSNPGENNQAITNSWSSPATQKVLKKTSLVAAVVTPLIALFTFVVRNTGRR